MATTYTVKKGDTLSEIALTYKDSIAGDTNAARIRTLMNLNNIKDPDYIVVGQVLKFSGTADTVKSSTSSRATINVFGLQSNTDRTVYATWTWSKSNTENYQIYWYYDTGDGVWFIGTNTTVTDNQSTYTAPSNANRVKFKVKPISKMHEVNGKETSYWTASWSTEKSYDFANNPPTTPSAPSVKIEKYKLTASLENLNVNATSIQFQVVKNDKSVFKTGTATIKTNSASYSCTVDAGGEYKVRCRSYRNNVYSDWSEYSGNVGTIPAVPKSITTCRASSETSVYLEWSASNTATSYEIEYTTKKEYFDGSDQTTTISNIEYTHYEKTGLESGEQYFFRVRAGNDIGKSAWSGIKSIVIGKDPAAPTTWSSSTTVITGEDLTLYWVHNAEDESSQTYAELEMYVDGVKETHTIKNTTNEEEKDKTSSYVIDTTDYPEGTKIQWRVRTAGITKAYGDWSVQRTIDIYAPPTLEFSVTNINGDSVETLESFPFYAYGLAGPNTQVPIGYHLAICANVAHETVDRIGNLKNVNKGEQIYSKYFDTSDALLVELTAGNLDLENNIEYIITCVVTMDSGLTAEESRTFTVSWADDVYEPNAEIGIDKDTLVAHIGPYCEDENGDLIDDVYLSVYRREFDGTFTTIATELSNTGDIYVTDPHPALDYARYRIVATSKTTGAVSYYDAPGYPVGEKAIIIQWDEEWTSFEASTDDPMEEPPWSGSLLKLPYNIDVSDKHQPDTTLMKYAGRKHPVSYYGTQLGQTSVWTTVIPKSDKETLYSLRRLAAYMGDVYVREPSGSGYWANITVSFNQTHCDLTIPISLDVVRVEGGM